LRISPAAAGCGWTGYDGPLVDDFVTPRCRIADEKTKSHEEGRRVMRALSWTYLAVAYALIFLPVVVLVAFSFQDGRLPVPPFKGVTLDWYAQVLSNDDLTAALLNSLLVATLSSLVALILGFLAAHALARTRLPGSVLMRGVLIAPLTVSTLIIALGLLNLFNQIGLRPSLVAAGIGHVVINLPLCFAITYAAMGDHQKNAERAARDLGASEWQVLAHVSAPMLAAPLAAAFFLSVTFSWDEFIIAFLLTRFDVTLPVEIWSMLKSGLSPATNAVGSLVFIVSVTLVILLELFVFRRRT
jgi:spermidine/putrescine transport system permease protein